MKDVLIIGLSVIISLLCIAIIFTVDWKKLKHTKKEVELKGDPVLDPTDFDESNLELKAPADMPECGSLHTFHDKEKGTYISFWKVDEDQLERIKREGGIWLGVIAGSHPPIFITTEKPIEAGKEG